MPKLDPYVTHTLMRDLTGHDRRPASFLVYLWLAAEARAAWHRHADQFYRGTRRKRRAQQERRAQDAVRWLIKRRLLAAKKNAAAIPTY